MLFFAGTTSDMQTEEREEKAAISVLCFGDIPGIDVIPCATKILPNPIQSQEFGVSDHTLPIFDILLKNFNNVQEKLAFYILFPW